MPVYGGTKPTAIGDALRKFTSLDPQETSLTEDATEFGLGFVPILGQAMALRDFERSRRADDKLGMGISAASLLPWGRLLKSGKKANKLGVLAGEESHDAPQRSLDLAKALRDKGASPQAQWDETAKKFGKRDRSFVDPKDLQAKFEIMPEDPNKYFKHDFNNADLDRAPLADVINNPRLFHHIPELNELEFSGRIMSPRYPKGQGETLYNPASGPGRKGLIQVEPDYGKDMAKFAEHELSHPIQDFYQGWGKGTNPKHIQGQWIKQLFNDNNIPRDRWNKDELDRLLSRDDQLKMGEEAKKAYYHAVGEARAFGGEDRLAEMLRSGNRDILDIVPSRMSTTGTDQNKLWVNLPKYEDWIK